MLFFTGLFGRNSLTPNNINNNNQHQTVEFQSFDMRAIAYFKQNDIHFSSDLPEPRIGADDEVLIDVSWCGVCGTDLHEYLDGPIFMPKDGETNPLSGEELPQPLGHEFSGVVAEVGPKVTKVKVGDHVVVEASLGCLDTHRWSKTRLSCTQDKPCGACRKGFTNCCEHNGFTGLGVVGGAFAEKVVAGERHCIKVSPDLPLDVAALVEPLSVSWHALRSAGFQKGMTACILGAGPIGLTTIAALKGAGAKKIVVSELAQIRREFAQSIGAEVFDPTAHGTNAAEVLKKMSGDDDGFDFAFDCSGVKATFDMGLAVTTFHGVCVNVAIWGHKPVDYYPMLVTCKEKILTGSIGYTTLDFESVVNALQNGDIPLDDCKKLISGKYTLEDGWEKGFMQLMHHKDKCIKILLTPNNHGELKPAK